VISLDSGPVEASSPLTLFNGPRLNGNPTVVIHARTTVPATQTYAIVVPIERRGAEFRYRALLNVPPIAGGRGAITHIDVEVGRRYRAGGQLRSYVSARCSDGILRTHGRFTFGDGRAAMIDLDSHKLPATRSLFPVGGLLGPLYLDLQQPH